MRIGVLSADFQDLLDQLAVEDAQVIFDERVDLRNRRIVAGRLVFLLEHWRSFPSYSQRFVASLNFVLQLLAQR